MKLSLLLLATAGASAVAQNPFDDLMKCAQAGATSDQCTSTSISDGESCKFCTSDSLGQAICTTSQASQAMKQFLPDLDCGDTSLAVAAEEPKKAETDGLSRLIFLSAIGVTAQDPFSDIMACAQSSASPDQCAATEVSDGSECVFCTSDSVQQSICTTESASEMLKQLLPDLDCGGDEAEDSTPTIKDSIQDLLLCAQSGANADQCASAEMSDGEHCVMCKSASVSQDLCTTPSASAMMKQFIPDLQCGSDASSTTSTGDQTDIAVNDSIQDIMMCAQASTSADNCKSTSISDGSDCFFCTSESLRTSVCTTSEASEMIKGFVQDVKCSGDANRLRGGKIKGKKGDEGILDLIPSSCIPSSGLDDEACSEAKDSSTGDDCVWCPSLAGNYGMCLSHEEAVIASKKGWLKCPEVPIIAIE
uniref:Uncharacterized protein n=1 Tax=Minutocellus polymorphus TaxID=265543 RepID=A0A7S0ALK1_9STRA